MSNQSDNDRSLLEQQAVEMVIQWRSSSGYRSRPTRPTTFFEHCEVGRQYLKAYEEKSYFLGDKVAEVWRLLRIAEELGIITIYLGKPLGRNIKHQPSDNQVEKAMRRLDRLDLTQRQNSRLKGITGSTDRFYLVSLLEDNFIRQLVKKVGITKLSGKTRDEIVSQANLPPKVVNDIAKYLKTELGWTERSIRRNGGRVRILTKLNP